MSIKSLFVSICAKLKSAIENILYKELRMGVVKVIYLKRTSTGFLHVSLPFTEPARTLKVHRFKNPAKQLTEAYGCLSSIDNDVEYDVIDITIREPDSNGDYPGWWVENGRAYKSRLSYTDSSMRARVSR